MLVGLGFAESVRGECGFASYGQLALFARVGERGADGDRTSCWVVHCVCFRPNRPGVGVVERTTEDMSADRLSLRQPMSRSGPWKERITTTLNASCESRPCYGTEAIQRNALLGEDLNPILDQLNGGSSTRGVLGRFAALHERVRRRENHLYNTADAAPGARHRT